MIGLSGLKRKEKSENDDPERDWALLFKMGWDKLWKRHFMSIYTQVPLEFFIVGLINLYFHFGIDNFIVTMYRPFAVWKYYYFQIWPLLCKHIKEWFMFSLFIFRFFQPNISYDYYHLRKIQKKIVTQTSFFYNTTNVEGIYNPIMAMGMDFGNVYLSAGQH